jgi:hypothetical protein
LYFEAGAREVWLCDQSGTLGFYHSGETEARQSTVICPKFPPSFLVLVLVFVVVFRPPRLKARADQENRNRWNQTAEVNRRVEIDASGPALEFFRSALRASGFLIYDPVNLVKPSALHSSLPTP